LPDRLTENQVSIQLSWTADARTAAIERQARLAGFQTPQAYFHQAIAAVIAGNEEDTAITDDGTIIQMPHDRIGRPWE
jgi:2-C-methyl-D-erythritol 4-phosphate cytidylyltransferase